MCGFIVDALLSQATGLCSLLCHRTPWVFCERAYCPAQVRQLSSPRRGQRSRSGLIGCRSVESQRDARRPDLQHRGSHHWPAILRSCGGDRRRGGKCIDDGHHLVINDDLPAVRVPGDADDARGRLSDPLYLPQCGEQLRPRPGDCCVYCSYGSVHCPAVQREQLHRSSSAT